MSGATRPPLRVQKVTLRGPFRRAALGLALSCAFGTTALAQANAELRSTAQGTATVESFGVGQLKSLVPGGELGFTFVRP